MEQVETRIAFTEKGEEVYGANEPEYKTGGAVGFDLRAASDEVFELVPVVFGGGPLAIPAGLVPAIPEGYEMQVRPRSGLAANFGVTVVNAPGTVDPDFRGEVKVILSNLSPEAVPIRKGDRIAQAVIAPVVAGSRSTLSVVPHGDLDATERGAGGLGSTG